MNKLIETKTRPVVVSMFQSHPDGQPFDIKAKGTFADITRQLSNGDGLVTLERRDDGPFDGELIAVNPRYVECVWMERAR